MNACCAPIGHGSTATSTAWRHASASWCCCAATSHICTRRSAASKPRANAIDRCSSRACSTRARDEDWLMAMAHAADAVGICRDTDAARLLYPRLLPHAARNVAHLGWWIYFGSCAHWLGVLAALLDEPDRARAHFEAALEMNARLGARPALLRTQLEYARFLSASDAPRARALLRATGSAAEQLGMIGLAAEAQALLA